MGKKFLAMMAVVTQLIGICFAAPVSPSGYIKVEVKGTVVSAGDNLNASYVSVRSVGRSTDSQETRIYFWLSEGEWKISRDAIPALNGKDVVIIGAVAQLPSNSETTIPKGALYFLPGFKIQGH